MNQPGTLMEIVRYWFDKAEESLLSAQDELSAGRLSFAVNRIYYACFYAVSGVLMAKNLRFKKHSGVRASFHQHLVKTGKIARIWAISMMNPLKLASGEIILRWSFLTGARLRIC